MKKVAFTTVGQTTESESTADAGVTLANNTKPKATVTGSRFINQRTFQVLFKVTGYCLTVSLQSMFSAIKLV
jgi:hypothetical protein